MLVITMKVIVNLKPRNCEHEQYELFRKTSEIEWKKLREVAEFKKQNKYLKKSLNFA